MSFLWVSVANSSSCSSEQEQKVLQNHSAPGTASRVVVPWTEEQALTRGCGSAAKPANVNKCLQSLEMSSFSAVNLNYRQRLINN